MTKILLIIGLTSFRILCFSQNYDAELILQRTNIVIKNNKLTKNLHFEIKIHNRAGEKYTKITIPYSKLNKLRNIEAYIKESNGRIVRKLKKSEIVERSSISNFSFYEDEFVKEFTLKHNSYPYIIVYSYQIIQDEFLYIDYWTPVIDSKIPTTKANLNLSIPKEYKISYRNQDVNSPKIDSTDNSVNFHWHTSYTDVVKSEIFTPSIFKFLPSVTIVPQEFNYEKRGSFKDWNSYGNWQQELLQGLNELPDNEKNKILLLIKNVEEDKEKIKILYHYLQDVTRYVNVKIETGGLKPYPAIYVAQNKYGDCKALTNYFKSILDYIKIPSYYTKVFAGNPIKEIDKNFPSQQFNHVILYIRLKDEDIWLDCTSNGAFNYLGTFTQNRDAFIIDYDKSNFFKTPALKPIDVLETRKIEVNYNLQNANVKFQNTYKGDIYENILNLERNYNESEKLKILRKYIVDEGFDLLDYQVSKLDRDSVRIKLSYKATSQQIYKHYGNDILVGNIAFSIPYFEKPTVRKLPVQIDYPIFKIDTLIYDIPIGYKLSKNIFNESISNRFGQYKFDIYENQGKILVIKSLLICAGNYPITEYEDFYSFYKQIVEGENKTHISLNK
jgi:hypothetical protein